MPLSPELIAAYRKAHYVIFAQMRGSPELVIRIGKPNPGLDALMQAHGAATAAFVTAANPRGKRRGAFKNRIAFHSLKKLLRKKHYPHLAGEGRDPEGRWAAEPSLLAVGISRADAEALGRTYEQNAIVFVDKGRAPELVPLV